MTMFEALEKNVRKLPFDAGIKQYKDTRRAYQAIITYDGCESIVDMQRTCAPGETKHYCWLLIVTAMVDIYRQKDDREKARLWLDAIRNPGLINAENH